MGAVAAGALIGAVASQDYKAYSGSENTTDEDNSDDYIDDLPVTASKRSAKPRASVSAEAFGAWNNKGDFQPRVIEKSE